jgi:hypothetical protein
MQFTEVVQSVNCGVYCKVRGEMTVIIESAPSPRGSNRPRDPIRLLVDRDVKTLWQARNFRSNRFSVVNLEFVIGRLGLEHTNAKKYFEKAKIAIDADGWNGLYRFDYGCSHTHIYPNNLREARQFGHAATVIVAMEFAAAELEPGYDVYTVLRILPATYFVDLFDRAELEKARKTIEKFDEHCLSAIGQEFDKKLLDQHSWGMTITKAVAEKLLAHLKSKIPAAKYGPVRCSGDPDQHTKSLATKNRASDLTIPVTLDIVPEI